MPAIFLLLCLCILSQSSYIANGKSCLHNIYADPVNGTDSPECLTLNSSATPCLTLDHAFSYRNDSTCYILNPHTDYNLTEPVPPFKDLKSLMIRGGEGSVVSCGGEVGLAFVNVSTIDIMDVIFLHCAETRNSTSRNTDIYPNVTFYEFEVGLYFYLCKDVSMDKVNVSFSPNATGVVMYNTAGTNSILNSVFMNNTVSNTQYGGGGFYVEFSYCVPGDYACRNNKTETSPILGARYSFMNSNFSDNIASNEGIEHNTTYIVPYHTYHQAFGRGGGLSVFMKGAAMNNVFEISNCTFENNRAQWGGGLFVEFHDDTANNSVYVTNCILSDNHCEYTLTTGTGGGGMRMGHYVFQKTNSNRGNHVKIAYSRFVNNSAMYGGGVSVSPTLQDTDKGNEAFLELFNVNFTYNVAKQGAALYTGISPLITEGVMMKVKVSNCSFVNNTVEYADFINLTNSPHAMGIGVVYINKVRVTFQGVTIFKKNNGTALAVAGIRVNFTKSVTFFSYNYGYIGGAITLLGSTYILIGDDTQMYFIYNKAIAKGGAIYNRYIEMDNTKTQPNCFVRHRDPFRSPDNWRATFRFYNNTAQNGQKGNSIHTSSLLPCVRAGGNGYYSDIKSVFCWNNWIYYFDSSVIKAECFEHITSDIGIVHPLPNQSNSMQVFPGQTFTLPYSIMNDYQESIINSTSFTFTPNTTNSGTVYFWGADTSLSGRERSHVEIILFTLGVQNWKMKFVVDLIQCPPGLIPTKEDDNGIETVHTKCKCSPSTYGGRVSCDPYTLKVKMDINFWMGLLNGEYLVGLCPPGFCASSNASYIFLPNTSAALSGVVCNTNRMGVMCGECTNGSGPAVNSATFDCVHCTNIDLPSNIAKYIASIYVPLAALFTLLIVFDIRLTTGPANAFIIYSQVISSSFNLGADGQIPLNEPTNASSSFKDVVQTYKLIYGIFNLEFFENLLHPLCLNPTFNALTVLSLDYGVAIFPLVMIILVIICLKVKELFSSFSVKSLRKVKKAAKCCPWRRQSISEALLPAFAAFILLSYTKFCLTSSHIIRLQSLYDKNMATIAPPRAYYAGQLVSTSAKYVYPYLLPSTLIFAIFVCIPPLLLLVYPLKIFEWCLSKITCLWKFYPVDKVHVFLDTFQGCYKNNMRFFAGLYFLFRLTVNALYLADHTWLERFVIQQVACVIMVALISICQPYNAENSFLNQVDALIFANLAIINAISLFLYTTSLQGDISSNLSTIIFQYILVFLPLVYMIGYIIWYFLFYRQRCLKKKFFKRLFQSTSYTSLKSVAADNKQRLKRPHTRSEVDINDIIIEEEDEALFARAELSNHYQKPPDVAVHHSYTTTTTTSSSGRGSSKKTGSSQPLANSNGSHAHSRISSHGYGTMSSHSTTSTN